MQSSEMSCGRAATWLAGFFVAAFTLTLGGILYAGNQWWCWHWGDKSVTSTVGSVGGGTTELQNHWQTVLQGEIDDWGGTCMTLPEGSTGAEIRVDAGFYGTNGWLGIARLLEYDAGACLILKAEALQHRSYLDGGSYDDIDDKHVGCQEIGHTLGLDHRKGPKNRTCIRPDFHFSFGSANHRVDSDAFIYAGLKALKALRRSTPNG